MCSAHGDFKMEWGPAQDDHESNDDIMIMMIKLSYQIDKMINIK